MRPAPRSWRDWRPHHVRLRRNQMLTLGLISALVLLVVVALVRRPDEPISSSDLSAASIPVSTPPPADDTIPVPLTGRLGVSTGTDLPATRSFENLVGRKMTYETVFAGRTTWSEIAHPGQNITEWKDSGHRVVMAVPMLPDSAARTDSQKLASMRGGADGDDNQYFVTLGKELVAAHQQSAVLRVGWEFNLKSWSWGISDETVYKRFYRQIVNAMRTVPGQKFKFDWNPNNGFNIYDGSKYYPGDQYVDYVGVDAYDIDGTVYDAAYRNPKKCSASCRLERQQRAWDEVVLGGPRGLSFWTDFAASHHKPVSLPEWGLWNCVDHAGGVDDPNYISMMYSFITYAPNNVAYANYFNQKSQECTHTIQSTSFPDSRKVFLKLFGG